MQWKERKKEKSEKGKEKYRKEKIRRINKGGKISYQCIIYSINRLLMLYYQSMTLRFHLVLKTILSDPTTTGLLEVRELPPEISMRLHTCLQ